jgi:hypothetical protein
MTDSSSFTPCNIPDYVRYPSNERPAPPLSGACTSALTVLNGVVCALSDGIWYSYHEATNQWVKMDIVPRSI